MERITVAIRMAATKPEVFDDVVLSNEDDLRFKSKFGPRLFVCFKSQETRARAYKPDSRLSRNSRQDVVYRTKRHCTCRRIMYDVVDRFKTNWEEEAKRQNDMAKRARDFAEMGFVLGGICGEAELLCDFEGNNGKASWVLLSLLVGVVAPMLSVLPVVFALENKDEDPSRDQLVASSVWIGTQGFAAIFLLHPLNRAFAKILGSHTLCLACEFDCVYVVFERGVRA